MQELEEILEEIREKAIELKNKHWGGDERHLTGKGVEAMCVQAEQIIRKHLSRENGPEITRLSRDNAGWIPVEERLPEDDEMMLVTCETKSGRRSVNRAWYGNGFWHGSGSMSGVIAWQPLPEPYRSERRDNHDGE